MSLSQGLEQASKKCLHRDMFWLLLFVSFAEFLPSEPFLVDYLISKGFANQQVSDDIFGLYFYFHLIMILLVGFLAEYAGRAVTILVCAICGFVTVMLTWHSSSMFVLQMTQLTVSISTAGHGGAVIAFVVELNASSAKQLKRHIYWTRVVFVLSDFASATLGSIMRSTLNATYTALWVISSVSQALSVIAAFGLVCSWELRRQRSQIASEPIPQRRSNMCHDIWKKLQHHPVAEWVYFGVVTHTIHLIVTTFWTSLIRAQTGHKQDSNGFVNGIAYLLAACVLLGLAELPILQDRRSRWFVIPVSLGISGSLVFGMGLAPALWQVYTLYVIYQLIFRITGAVYLHHLGQEVQMQTLERSSERHDNGSGAAITNMGSNVDPRWIELSPQERSENAMLSGLGKTTRLALLFSVIDVTSAMLQIFLQYIFKHLRIDGHSRTLEMPTRFVILGIIECVAAFLFSMYVLARRSCT